MFLVVVNLQRPTRHSGYTPADYLAALKVYRSYFLLVSVSLQNNADENISCYEMSCDQYQMFINLVQYYQMETRWSIKKLLLKTFTAACHLDHIIVDILLTSLLPLEIVSEHLQQLSIR